MHPYSSLSLEPKRYKLKLWIQVFSILLALLVVGAAAVVFYTSQNKTSGNTPGTLLLVAFALIFGIGFCFRALRQSAQLDHDSVSVTGLLGTKSLRIDSIKGRRTISSRNGSYTILEGKNPDDNRLSISDSFDFDDQWNSWIQSLPDLDELDRQSAIDAIASNDSLGGTPEARLAKLSRAKTIAVLLTVVAVALDAALWFAGKSFDIHLFGCLDVVLVLLPWIVLMLQAQSPLLYSTLGNKKDPRANLLFVILASGIGLLASPFSELQSVAPMTILAYGSIPGIILAIALYSVASGGAKPPVAFIVLLGMGCLYGCGLITQINTQLDHSTPHAYTAEIERKTFSTGRSTTYYLRLSPWDQFPEGKKVTVSSRLYHSVEAGDSVCITGHDGTLKAPWYTVSNCH